MSEERKKKRKIVIEDVITKDPEKLEPCLVKFANGTLKNSADAVGMLYRNNSEKYLRLRKQRILKVPGRRLTYVGTNFDEKALTDSNERIFLGVLDKETNRMKLVEMSSYLLHPQLNDASTKQNSEDQNVELSWHEQRSKLVNSFGGRKSRAMMKRSEANKVNIEDMSTVLTTALNKATTDDVDVEDLLDTDSYEDLLPPCDRDATIVRNVYPLENIITDDELMYFNDTAVEYLDPETTPEESSRLLRQTVANIKLLYSSEYEQAKYMCVCLFTEQLIQLFRKRKYKMKKDLMTCPDPLKEKVNSYFMEGKKRIRSKQLEDRLIAHVVILALIANKFEVSWQALSSSLGIRKERLESIITVIGATFSRDTGVIKLKLPLAKLNTSKPLKKRKIYS